MSKKGRPKKPDATPGIPDLREEINRVDGEILERLARRRELSQSVARAKATGAEIRDPKREEEIRILADLVELQESEQSSWHVPQSASRSELPSSQP